MGGGCVLLDGLRYARQSPATRRFGTLSHRGREAYSSHEGQSRCAARYSFHCQPPFELSGQARASRGSCSEVESHHGALLRPQLGPAPTITCKPRLMWDPLNTLLAIYVAAASDPPIWSRRI